MHYYTSNFLYYCFLHSRDAFTISRNYCKYFRLQNYSFNFIKPYKQQVIYKFYHPGAHSKIRVNWSAGIEDITADKAEGVRKVIENGRIVILKDGHKYNTLGIEVK